MGRITISKDDLNIMAEKVKFIPNNEVFEETRKTAEDWINAALILAEKMVDPRFSDTYPYCVVKRSE